VGKRRSIRPYGVWIGSMLRTVAGGAGALRFNAVVHVRRYAR
jgi:hypothetical protein